MCGLDGLKDLSNAPKHQAEQTDDAAETAIVHIRMLRERRDQEETKYAFIGTVAIHKERQELGDEPPCVKTIHHIWVRNGRLTPEPAPQPVREGIERHDPSLNVNLPGQLQPFDFIGPRDLQGRPQKYSFYTLRDVWRRRIAIETGKNHQARTICKTLLSSWQRMGMPTMLQHDNAFAFRGRHRYPRSAGRLTKRCDALGIESVFVPAREPWRNGTIENFTGRFQRLVLTIQHMQDCSQRQHEVTAFELVATTHHPHVPRNGKTSREYERSLHVHPKLRSHDVTWGRHVTIPPTGAANVSFIWRIRKSGQLTIAAEKVVIEPDLAGDDVYAAIVVKEQMLKIW